MATQHIFIKAEFSYERMLEMLPADARQYFILNLFVPIAYDLLQTIPDTDRVFGLMLGNGNAGTIPWFVEGSFYNKRPTFSNASNEDDYVNYSAVARHFTRTLGAALDEANQSKALAHAFKNSLGTPRRMSETDQAPLVAVFMRINNAFSLNVVVKDRHALPSSELIINHDCVRSQLISVSEAYDSRAFNKLTGEWIGLCDAGAKDICASCRKIYSSPCAENAYGPAK